MSDKSFEEKKILFFDFLIEIKQGLYADFKRELDRFPSSDKLPKWAFCPQPNNSFFILAWQDKLINDKEMTSMGIDRDDILSSIIIVDQQLANKGHYHGNTF